MRDAEIIIHNAAFDVGFLDAELRRIGRPAFTEHVGRVIDSLSMARDSFPGKSNSLDALCKRFEVNNPARELHGALLDAGLLAEVYIRMTRGQNSLVIDAADALAADLAARPIDFSALELIVVAADEAKARRTRRCSPRSTRPAAATRSGAARASCAEARCHGTMTPSRSGRFGAARGG